MPVAEAIVGDGGWRVVMDVKKEEENGLDYKYLRERRFDGRGCIVHLNSKDDGVDYCKMQLTMAFDGLLGPITFRFYHAYSLYQARVSTLLTTFIPLHRDLPVRRISP